MHLYADRVTTTPRPTRLIYVDDSGAEVTGFATFSWIEVPLDEWGAALEEVLEWRSDLTRVHQIPKHFELHATKFANGRGAPSLDPTWNVRKAHRSAVLDEAFARFATWSWLRAGTVYSESALRRVAFAKERARVYAELIGHLDDRLAAAREWGLLVMDGDGTDTSYITAHRELPIRTRSLIEDPAFQHSSRSQWVQIADVIAYAAYQKLVAIPEKQFAWGWYDSLGDRAEAAREV